MNHQLASDFYPGWNSGSPTPAAQRSVFRRLMQRLGLAARARAGDGDPDPGPSDDVFFKLGEALLRRTRIAGQPLSVVVFELNDLPELESVFGRKVAKRVAAQALETLKRVAGRKGLARRTGPSTFAVLLPQLWVDGALAVIHANFGRTCCIEVETGDEEIVLVPDFLAQTVREGFSVQAEYEWLRGEMAKSHERKQRHLQYLERERVSHSKPMHLRREGLATLPGDFARNVLSTDLHAPIPATVPVPLGRS